MKALICVALLGMAAPAQDRVIVRPSEIDDVLVNPGVGFMIPSGGGGSRPVPRDHPAITLDYLRVYWNALEPEEGNYRWELIDRPLRAAHEHGRTMLFRIMPYGSSGNRDDVPAWYRAMVGPEPDRKAPYKIRTNPEDPRYARCFGRLVREAGKRYDGHPDVEFVDVSIVGAWGEGAGSAELSEPTREALVDAYLEAFHKTPLVMLLTDERTNKYGVSKRPVGWRADCLGDMGGFNPNWSHMLDYYPEGAAGWGLRDAWQKAPVSFEACWVVATWKQKGWSIDYIVDQSLKWHISSFNNGGDPVPPEWRPAVDRWLKRMGYRFVLRKFTYPARVAPGGTLAYESWWENKGVAPCYTRFPLALRLAGAQRREVLVTDADIRGWLPGDALADGRVFVPFGMPAGEYQLQIALLDPVTREPKLKLAIAGVQPDGWYNLGRIRVE